ncbi:MAG: tetratricopeptide repeat protein [Polyangia bacterium]
MTRAAGLTAAVWVMAFASAASAASAKDVAEGRRHLHKANELASQAKCDAAVREYTFAYQKLHDPVVLFNRAECYRRLGQNGPAALDYRAFLDAFPRAPNRAEVEARLAAMEGLPPPALAPPPVRMLPPPAPRVAAPAPIATEPATPLAPPTTIPPRAPPPPEVTEGPAAPAPREAPVISLEDRPVAPATAESASQGRLWLWVAIGAAVAGGALGAYLVLRSPGASPPATELGNYKF